MWSDTVTVRLSDYEKNLRACPLFYDVTEELQKEPVDTVNLLKDSLQNPGWMHGDTKPSPAEQSRTIRNICDYVVSPALHGYVLWVLRRALEKGISRLYFLARDGYFMYRTADCLCRQLSLPVECRYLYCSRYSLRIPLFHLYPDEALEYICRGGIDVTLRKVLNRTGIAESEQNRVLDTLRCSEFGESLLDCAAGQVHTQQLNQEAGGQDFADIVIPYAMLARLRGDLKQDSFFMECLMQHSAAAFPALSGYFRQEGLLDELPMAVVDSGWVGSMQKVMNQLLKTFGKQRELLTGFYWGLYELPDGVDASDYECYYFSPEKNLREKVYFSNCLFEGIFSAPHGMTLRYQERDGRYEPVLAEQDDANVRFMEMIRARTGDWTDILVRHMAQDVDLSANDPEPRADGRMPGAPIGTMADSMGERAVIRSQLFLFMGQPTPPEAYVFGSLPFSDDVLEYGGQMAAPMSEEELCANHAGPKILSMLGIRHQPLKESAWYEASAVMGGHRVKRHLRRYAGYKYLLYMNKTRNYRRQRKAAGYR